MKHFACDVKYDIDGFLDKNRNEIAQEITSCLDSSDYDIVSGLQFDSSIAVRTPRKLASFGKK